MAISTCAGIQLKLIQFSSIIFSLAIFRMYSRVISTMRNGGKVAAQSRRHLTTHKITSQSAHERLTAQRRNRPIAPHMTIYKWQYVSSASALHRITGLLLSGSLYGLATAYLFVPALGLQFDWSDMVTAFGSLPTGVKAALKFGSSMPFSYHSFNGVKHLVWDSGHLLSKSQSGRASWAVLACSMSTSLGLALYQF